MDIRISSQEPSCTHEASDSQFDYGQIMQCKLTYALLFSVRSNLSSPIILALYTM